MGPESSKKAEAARRSASEKPPLSSPIPSAHSKKKNPALIASVVGLIVLIGVFGILWLTVFSKPSQDDYRAALTTVNEAGDNYTTLSQQISASSLWAAGGDVDRKYDDLQKAVDDYKAVSNELDGQRAFNDDEVGGIYDAFKAQNEKFIAYSESMLGSFKQAAGVRNECTANTMSSSISAVNRSNATEYFDEILADCHAAVDAAKEAGNAVVREFAELTDKVLADIREQFIKAAKAYKDRDADDYTAALSQMRTIATKFSSDSQTINTKLQDEARASDVKEQLNNLGNALAGKLNA